jgi:hypothetical protein
MNKRVGLWIDHTKALIVSITDGGEDRERIPSLMDHYIRYSVNVPGDGTPEDERDGRFWRHLNEYYDKIVEHVHDAGAIQIFGPGIAKYQFQKRLDMAGLSAKIVSIDDVENESDQDIVARVRDRFPARSGFDLS